MSEEIRLNRIKSATEEKGLKSWMLAPYLNVAPGTVSSWNQNKSQPTKEQFADIASLLESNQQELAVSTVPPGHMQLAEAMKNAATRFEKQHGSAYVVKVSKNGNESKTLNPKLKALLRDIVVRYEKDGTLPK